MSEPRTLNEVIRTIETRLLQLGMQIEEGITEAKQVIEATEMGFGQMRSDLESVLGQAENALAHCQNPVHRTGGASCPACSHFTTTIKEVESQLADLRQTHAQFEQVRLQFRSRILSLQGALGPGARTPSRWSQEGQKSPAHPDSKRPDISIG